MLLRLRKIAANQSPLAVSSVVAAVTVAVIYLAATASRSATSNKASTKTSSRTFATATRPAHEAEEAKTATKSRAAQVQSPAVPGGSISLAHWKRIAKRIKQAEDARQKAFRKHWFPLWECSRDFIPGTFGVRNFLDEALSLSSHAASVQGTEKIRSRVEELFATHIFPVDILTPAIKRCSESVESDMCVIDNQLLIDLQADVDLDPQSLARSEQGLSPVQPQLDTLMEEVLHRVEDSLDRSVTAFLASVAGFEAGRQTSRALLADENGEVSVVGELLTWGVGFLTQEATSWLSNDMKKARQELDSKLWAEASKIRRSFDLGGSIYVELAKSPARHNDAVFEAVTTSLGIDLEWARENMPE